MTYENFNSDDITEIIRLLKTAFPKEIVSDAIVKEKIFDDLDFNFELTFKALAEGKIIGFIMGVIRKNNNGNIGFIKLLAVKKNYKRENIASGLLKLVEKKMKSEGISKLRMCDSYPNYFLPGVDPFSIESICFLEANGFNKCGDCISLSCKLDKQELETRDDEIRLHQIGIKLFRPKIQDYEEIKKWSEKYFPEFSSEISAAFLNEPVSLHLAEHNGNVVAFSTYKVNNKSLGNIGPIGTVPDYRGNGIGAVLLKLSLRDLQQMGFKSSTIPCVKNIAFFVKNVNVRAERIFWQYEKLL